MKKRLTCALLAAVMALALAACGGPGGQESESPAPRNLVGFTFDVPEGFTVSADNGQLWLAPGYPADTSNITVTTAEYDKLFDTYTREMLEAVVISLLSEAADQEVAVVSDSFERTTLDGVDAIRYRYHLDLYGTALRQEIVAVNGANMGYTFTFTQAGTADWDDAYNACVDSIRFTLG